jgi:hypothetical protein
MKTNPLIAQTANVPSEKCAMIGGVFVSEEVHEIYQRDISKLTKERDDAEGKRDIYKYLCIGLAATLLLCGFLNSCVHSN